MAYDLATSDDPVGVSFGNGLLVTRAASGWEVCADERCWPLDDKEGWRAVALLENSPADVRAAFAKIGEGTVPLTPILKGALAMSAHWAGLAVQWIEGMTDAERTELKPALHSVAKAAWADQSLKQAAERAAQP